MLRKQLEGCGKGRGCTRGGWRDVNRVAWGATEGRLWGLDPRGHRVALQSLAFSGGQLSICTKAVLAGWPARSLSASDAPALGRRQRHLLKTTFEAVVHLRTRP